MWNTKEDNLKHVSIVFVHTKEVLSKLFWTILTLIVWPKNTETFLKIIFVFGFVLHRRKKVKQVRNDMKMNDINLEMFYPLIVLFIKLKQFWTVF